MHQACCSVSIHIFFSKEVVVSPSQGLSAPRGKTRVPREFWMRAQSPGTALRAPLGLFISCLFLLLDCEPHEGRDCL